MFFRLVLITSIIMAASGHIEDLFGDFTDEKHENWPKLDDPHIVEKIEKFYSKDRAYKLPEIDLRNTEEEKTNDWGDVLFNLPPF